MSGRFLWKVFGGMALVILSTIVVVDIGAHNTSRSGLVNEIERRLQEETVLFASLVEQTWSGDSFDIPTVEKLAGEFAEIRMTVVAEGGEVLFDTHRHPSMMDDHSSRPEIVNAGEFFTRFSDSVGREMIYFAHPVHSDESRVAFARMAVSTEDVDERVDSLRSTVRWNVVLAGAVATLIALWFATHVTRPLNEVSRLIERVGRGDTSTRVAPRGSDEFAQLGQAVNQMTDELDKRMDRIEQDQQLRNAILSGMAEGLLGVDKDQNVVLINSAAREMLLAGDDDPIGRPVWEVSRVPDVIKTIADCLETGQKIDSETHLKTESGERILGLGASPLSGEGPTRGCVLVLRELTELRRLESVRKDFVANVSHELKTPLTSMRGYLETILDDPDMEEDTRAIFLERASLSTERLSAIVTDLLTIARLDSADARVTIERMDLLEVVERCVRDSRSAAEMREIAIDVAPIHGPTPIEGDRISLGSAVSNLIDNAIKYSPEGSTVRVTIEERDGRAFFEVADQGPGIPVAERERIFERFYRVDKNRSRDLGGTGLGLSIVKNVVASHGGEVQVESTVGEGSRFQILLPLASRPDAAS